MIYFFVKTLVSALLIATISEIAKRSSFIAAILASLPLTSVLALIWFYHDGADSKQIAELSNGILYAVLPSLLFFLTLPFLLRYGLSFYPALIGSIAIMTVAYGIFVFLTKGQFG